MQPHLLVTVKKDETGTTAILISTEILRTSHHLKQPDASNIWSYLQEEMILRPRNVHNLDDLTMAQAGIAIDAFKRSLVEAEAVKGIDARKFHSNFDAERMQSILEIQLSAMTDGLGLAGSDLFDPIEGARVISEGHPIRLGEKTIGRIEAEVVVTPNEPGVAVISLRDVDGMLVWQILDKDVSPDLLRSSNDLRCAACVIAAWLDEALEAPDSSDQFAENPFGAAWIMLNKEPLEQAQRELAGITRERGQSL